VILLNNFKINKVKKMNSKLISKIKSEHEQRILDELKEAKVTKTSVAVESRDLSFLDAVSEYYGTSRTDIFTHVLHASIEDFVENLPKDDLNFVLDIAAKKDPSWESFRDLVRSKGAA
jgi:hypothetical protein